MNRKNRTEEGSPLIDLTFNLESTIVRQSQGFDAQGRVNAYFETTTTDDLTDSITWVGVSSVDGVLKNFTQKTEKFDIRGIPPEGETITPFETILQTRSSTYDKNGHLLTFSQDVNDSNATGVTEHTEWSTMEANYNGFDQLVSSVEAVSKLGVTVTTGRTFRYNAQNLQSDVTETQNSTATPDLTSTQHLTYDSYYKGGYQNELISHIQKNGPGLNAWTKQNRTASQYNDHGRLISSEERNTSSAEPDVTRTVTAWASDTMGWVA